MSNQQHTSSATTVFVPAASVGDCAKIAAAEFRYWNEHSTPEAIGGTAAAANILCAINGPRAAWHPQTNDPCAANDALLAAQYERDSLLASDAQLLRFVEAVNNAMPNFRCAFGGAADHAEAALAFLIADRERLHKAAAEVVEMLRPGRCTLAPIDQLAIEKLRQALATANAPIDPAWRYPEQP